MSLEELGSSLVGGRPAGLVDDEGSNVAAPNPTMTTSSVRFANSITCSTTTMHSYLTASMVQLPVGNEQDGDESGADVKKNCMARINILHEKFPIAFVLGGAMIGIGLGIALSYWNPDDPSAKEVVILWVGLIGDLFIRALKCIVMPLVFVSITISVMDMLSLGEQGTIVGWTIGLYLFTTVLAAIIGCISTLIFQRFYTSMNSASVDVVPEVRLGCQTDLYGDISSYLTEQDDGSVLCMASTQPLGNDTLFVMHDENGYFAKASEDLPAFSLSESIYQGLFLQLVDDNMIGIFYDNNFLGVIFLGAGFGVALTRLAEKTPAGIKWDRILTIQLFEELTEVFMLFVIWIVQITPVAIISLIAKAIGSQSDLGEIMKSLGYLLAAIFLSLFLQFTVVYCGLYLLFLKKNPLQYYKKAIPAFTMAFASSSSAATLPVTISCAVASGEVTEGIARFCLPLGATVNMDGTTIVIICECIWLAYFDGIVPSLKDYILLVVCATLGSMGAAPVPSAGIVLVLTTYNTVFGGTPSAMAYIMAIDWLINRCATTFNVGGDITVASIVSNKVSKKENSEKKAVSDVKETENSQYGSLPLSKINEVTSHSE